MFRFSLATRGWLTLAASALCVGQAVAASPALSIILPRGAQRGTETVLEFHGARLAEAVAGQLFRRHRVSLIRGLEQGPRGRGVVAGVVAGRQREADPRVGAALVFADEGAGHDGT